MSTEEFHSEKFKSMTNNHRIDAMPLYQTKKRTPARRAEKTPTRRNTSKKRNPKKTSATIIKFIPVVLFTGLLFVALSFFFHDAKVELAPKIKNAVVSDVFGAYKEPAPGEIGFHVIIASHEQKKELGEDVKVREVDIPASATVTIFNETSKPQRLSPGTRLQTESGTTFLTPNKAILVPAATSKENPGSFEVLVTAKESGEAGNIGEVEKLTIPGWYESGEYEKYEAQYATTRTPFEGGRKGFEPVLSTSAKAEIVKNLRKDLYAELEQKTQQQKKEGFVAVPYPASFSQESLEVTINANNRPEAILRGSMGVVLLPLDELPDFVGYYTVPGYSFEGAEISNIEDIKFTIESTQNPKLNLTEAIQFRVSGDVIFKTIINENEISTALSGAPRSEFHNLVKSTKVVESANVKIRPVWMKKLPVDPRDIEIIIKEKIENL